MLGDLSSKGHVTLSNSDKEAVREQLGRLLASSYFSHSKRFPTFLGFVVEQTLGGQAANIKERTLGIEIFGRDANYDTSSDPIVRVTATEIRKRVAQYYEDPARGDELRIALPSGSYIPHFYWPNGANGSILRTMALAVPGSLPDPECGFGSHSPAPRSPFLPRAGGHLCRRRDSVSGIGPGVANDASLGTELFLGADNHREWSSFILHGGSAAKPCYLASGRGRANPRTRAKRQPHGGYIRRCHRNHRFAEILQATGKQYTIRGEGITNFKDLQAGPTIFIGAFDNAWTLRLTNSLRYHFSNDPQMTQFRIVDSTAPLNRRWVVNRTTQMASNSYRDYAIVARFTDSDTGKVEVIVAGIGSGGTTAAAIFLTDSGDLAQVQRAAQAAGNKKNMELVLSTQIVNGESGSPKIEADYFW